MAFHKPLSKQTQEILIKATEFIGMRDRWIKGHGFEDGPEGFMHNYCSLGAIEKARRALNAGSYASSEVIGAVSETIGNRDIADWNDQPHRTHEEVKDVFCKTVRRVIGESDGTES